MEFDYYKLNFEGPAINSILGQVSVNTDNISTLSSNKVNLDASNITNTSDWKTALGYVNPTEISTYQVQSDWNAASGISSIANKPDIKKVSISYVDINDTEHTLYGTYSGKTATFEIMNTHYVQPYIAEFIINSDIDFGQYSDTSMIVITICNGGDIQKYTAANSYSDLSVFAIDKDVILGSDTTDYITSITKEGNTVRIVKTGGFDVEYIKLEYTCVGAA